MTAYTKTIWIDEIVTGTPKYRVTDDGDGVIAGSALIEIISPVTPGTPLNATNLNHLETGVYNAQAQADIGVTNAATANAAAATAQAKADAAIPKNIVTAIGQLIYSTASGVLAALAKPSASAVLQNSAGGTPSWRAIKQTVQIQVVDAESDVDTTSIAYFFIPSTLAGMNLTRAQAFVLTAGATNPTTIQVRNLTKYPSNDSLSTAISIASAGTVGTPGTVNTTYDDVSTDDKIKIYVTANSTTKAKGLIVVLEFTLP